MSDLIKREQFGLDVDQPYEEVVELAQLAARELDSGGAQEVEGRAKALALYHRTKGEQEQARKHAAVAVVCGRRLGELINEEYPPLPFGETYARCPRGHVQNPAKVLGIRHQEVGRLRDLAKIPESWFGEWIKETKFPAIRTALSWADQRKRALKAKLPSGQHQALLDKLCKGRDYLDWVRERLAGGDPDLAEELSQAIGSVLCVHDTIKARGPGGRA